MKKITPLSAVLFATGMPAFGSAQAWTQPAVGSKKPALPTGQARNGRKMLADA